MNRKGVPTFISHDKVNRGCSKERKIFHVFLENWAKRAVNMICQALTKTNILMELQMQYKTIQMRYNTSKNNVWYVVTCVRRVQRGPNTAHMQNAEHKHCRLKVKAHFRNTLLMHCFVSTVDRFCFCILKS